MAKKPTTARKPRAPTPAAKPAPAVMPAETSIAQDEPVHDPRPGADQQSQASNGAGAKPEGGSPPSGGAATEHGGSAADQQFQAVSGPDARPEGAAAQSDPAEGKGADQDEASATVDPADTSGAPAALGEESREQAGAASADRKGAAEEENQPEDTARPPVAGLDGATIVVTGPKKGRWRSGLYFGPEPTLLEDQRFLPAEGEPPHLAGERLYAILTDPRLTCVVRLEDGQEVPFPPEATEQMRQAIDAAAELVSSDGEGAE